ncbi:MAG: hypothetical protein J0M29_14975 [Chitinophagales bacterium]|nr:hypothetical protein [Chitinophagales bacterium]
MKFYSYFNLTSLLRCFLFAIPLISCNPSSLHLADLKNQNSLYYYRDMPYSGKVYSTYDGGQISFRAEFKDGIPYGEWQSIGYQGEIIQYGYYNPVIVDSLKVKSHGNDFDVKRIVFNEFYEGDYSILYVDLISNNVIEEIPIVDSMMQIQANRFMPPKIISKKFNKVLYLCSPKEI